MNTNSDEHVHNFEVHFRNCNHFNSSIKKKMKYAYYKDV